MSNDAEHFRVDRRAMARAFGRASAHYDSAALLQSEVRAELLSRLQFFPLQPRVIVDLGCGTARGASELRRRFRRARVLAIDVAPGMLRAARRNSWPWRRYTCLCADALALPLAAQSVDLVYSNLMLQWCDDPALAFAEVRRVLRPGGLLLFSTFGGETLQELRAAWAAADAAPHVSAFADMPLLASALQHAGMSEPVMDRDLRRHHHPDARALMISLRSIGAGNAAANRRRTLTGRERLARMRASYEQWRTPAGLPATWEVIYGAAFAPAESPGDQGRAATHAAGETHVPVAAIGRRSGRPPAGAGS
jgi:malonyl-CoA O-methyltransferase